MNEAAKFAEELIDFIHGSPSEFHVVENAVKIFEKNGFSRLDHSGQWDIVRGGRYFTTTNGSSFTAFIVGTAELEEEGFHILEAHTDSPTIKVKPQPEMVVDDYYLKLNTEVYGSPILNTWLDRPLTLAGRVSLRGDDPFYPRDRLVHFNKPLLCIPNLSIHHNKEVNTGVALNNQKDMLPIAGIIGETFEKDGYLWGLLSEEVGVDATDILDVELSMSEFDRGCVLGLNDELISSTKLDNLCLLHAGVRALVDRDAGGSTAVFCCFDNEEVGNRTRQGADSPMLSNILERISLGLGKNRNDYFRAVSRSFMISADMSHALHPNSPEKSDPVVKAKINGGPVIKFSGTQKFTTDSNSAAVFKAICEKAEVPYQYYANRSDSPGGSSAGPASTTQLDIRSVDVGLPIFAMHSIRELGGVSDNLFILKTFQQFFG